MPLPLPAEFQRTITDVFGADGERWLENFPALIDQLAKRWSLRLLPPYNLSYNYVAPAVREDGTPVVLKVGVPNVELISEMTALRHYNGHGMVRLIDSDEDAGAMLLERITPGVPLAEIKDDEMTTRIATEVMKRYFIPAPPDPDGKLRTAEGWSRGLQRLRREFNSGTGPYPQRAVEQAERYVEEILAASGPPMLLHGDLHHWNILSSERDGWLVLDPKGVVGEAEMEICQWMMNLWPEKAEPAALRSQAARRIAIFHEMLGWDEQRLWMHTLIRAVISSWWTYEDHKRVDTRGIAFIEAVASER